MTIMGKVYGAKLQAAIEKSGIPQKDICFDLRIDPALMSKVIRGTLDPPKEWFSESISKHPALSLRVETLKEWEAIDKLNKLGLPIPKAADISGLKPVEGFYRFPCLGTVTAGGLDMIDMSQDVEYYEWCDIAEYSTDMFCLRVVGDSMEPKIPDGAILLVRPAKSFRQKAIYVFNTDDGRSTLKLLKLSLDGSELVPVNGKYKPIPVSGFRIEKAYEVLEYKVSLL